MARQSGLWFNSRNFQKWWLSRLTGDLVQTLENLEMKKTLVAIAALAATGAFAQSSVTIYGNLDQTMFRGTDNGKTYSDIASNAGSTSTLGFRGKEDLGAGLSANFNLLGELSMKEGQMGSTTSGNAATSGGQKPNIFTRGATVGIASATYGSLDVGRVTDQAWVTQGTLNNTGLNSLGWNALTATSTNPGDNGMSTFTGKYAYTPVTAAAAAAVGDGTFQNTRSASYNAKYNGVVTMPTLGAGNTAQTGTAPLNFGGGLTYTTPNINGLVGSIQSFGTTNSYGTAKAGGGLAYSANYTTGGLRLAYGNTYRNGSNGEKAISMDVYGAEYKMGAYTFVGGITHTKFSGTFDGLQDNVTVKGLGIGYDVSPQIEVKGAWTQMQDDATGMSDYKTTIKAVTARYKFSARSSVYAGYGKADNTGANNKQSIFYGGTQPSVGAASNTGLLVGIKHAF
jgi:predicted porin